MPKQWKKFLSNGENKERLIEFLFCTWRKLDGTLFDKHLSIFIAQGSRKFYKYGIQSYLLDIEQFVCELYVNEARFKFCTKLLSEQCLPPTSNALMQHLLRVCYQAAIYKKSLTQWMIMSSLNNFGWQVKDGNFNIVWMINDPFQNHC